MCLLGQGVLVRSRFGKFGDPSRIARLVVAACAAYSVASLASSKADVLPYCFAATVVYGLLVLALGVVPRRVRRTR